MPKPYVRGSLVTETETNSTSQNAIWKLELEIDQNKITIIDLKTELMK